MSIRVMSISLHQHFRRSCQGTHARAMGSALWASHIHLLTASSASDVAYVAERERTL